MKPILFNTEMVRAILDGRKTMTRRVIKLPEGLAGRPVYDPLGLMYAGGIYRPKYQVGNILYVRETWQDGSFLEDNEGNIVKYIYKADDVESKNSYKSWGMKWRPSIHMPKEAARIFLKVTDVRVERLQDITIDGIEQEGIHLVYPIKKLKKSAHLEKLITLWDSTIKKQDLDKHGWEVNPWVWVIEFERVSKND